MPAIRRRDLILEVGGHGYENFLNAEMEGEKVSGTFYAKHPRGRSGKRFLTPFFPHATLFQQHPEWFGLDAPKESGGPSIATCCAGSNRDAMQYLTANVIKYVEAHPEIQVFDFRPPDMDIW